MRELKGDWKDLFGGFMVALDLRKMFLALCGIVATGVIFFVTIVLGDKLDREYVEVPKDLVVGKWIKAEANALEVIYKGRLTAVEKYFERRGSGLKTQILEGTRDVRKGGDPAIYIPFTILMVLALVAIWSYFGGAIARIAAYEIARDGERIETRKALQFSSKKFWSFFWAPLICLIGFGFFALCNYTGGFIGRLLDWAWIGAPLVALFLPLAILSGFIMTLIAVGTAAGLPLFTPAVAAEGTDSFDAVSRGFSYVYSRPWHYLGYQIVSAGYGVLCISFVILFTIMMCHLALTTGAAGFELCGAWGDGQFQEINNAAWGTVLSDEHRSMRLYKWDPLSIVRTPHPYGRLQTLANQIVPVTHTVNLGDLRGSHQVGGMIVLLWLMVTLGLALGYVVSYTISQQTTIYFILRKKVDGIEMNEVFEEVEEEAKPAEAPKPAAAPPTPEVKPPEPPKEEKK